MLSNLMAKKRTPLLSTNESYELKLAYEVDQDANKVNLASGVYRTEYGEAWIMPCVAKVKQKVVRENVYNHEELGSLGDPEFCKATVELLFDYKEENINTDGIFCLQTISGTGALRAAAEFLHNSLDYRIVYISDPTWENYPSIFAAAGFTDLRKYRYWHSDKKAFDLKGLLEDLSSAPKDSIVVFQPCAHNPTGCDPYVHQWKMIADVVKNKGLFPIFDAAYIGLASGSVVKDTKPLRIFADLKIEMIVAVSFGTNFLLYNERIGSLVVVAKNKRCIPAIRSHFDKTVRSLYGSPTFLGMKVIKTILKNGELSGEWKESLMTMAGSILELRLSLQEELITTHALGTWSHIRKTVGLFCFSGLTPRQVEHLIFYYHIYLMKNGTISICGLTYDNVDYVTKAIRRTVREYKS